MSTPRIEERRGRRVLVTNCCPLVHGKVEGGKLRMLSPHEKRNPHPVEFTPDDLRRIADALEKEGVTTLRA